MIARRMFSMSVVAGMLAFAGPMFAQKAASAPKNATAQCQDGTYSTAKTERGACSKHGGVKTWWGTSAPAPTPDKSSSSSKSSSQPSTTKTTAAQSSGASAAPKGTTAECKDGTYSKAKTRERACTQHGGVSTWFADSGVAQTAPQSNKPTSSIKAQPAPASPKTTSPKENAGGATATSGAGAPANATAKCKDGTYSFSKTHTGACSHHGGVAEWYK